VTVLSEDRFEVGEQSRALVHEVRIEVGQDALPPEEMDGDIEALRTELTEVIRDWARACLTGFAGELTEPELAAREAVLEMNAEAVST
jgi:hypothetical protein